MAAAEAASLHTTAIPLVWGLKKQSTAALTASHHRQDERIAKPQKRTIRLEIPHPPKLLKDQKVPGLHHCRLLQ